MDSRFWILYCQYGHFLHRFSFNVYLMDYNISNYATRIHVIFLLADNQYYLSRFKFHVLLVKTFEESAYP